MMLSVIYPVQRKRKILLSMASLVIIGMIAITASTSLLSPARSEVMPAKTLPAQPTRPSRELSLSSHRLQVDVMRVTITTTGFDPDELTRPAGDVVLAIDNRSGLEEVWLRLDREGGGRLIDVRVDRSRLDWRGTVNLLPGHYTLTEANHPDWACRITVE